MEILKGKVQDPGFPDTEVTYLKTDDGKTYFFIENGTLKNGNIISTPILKEGIGHAPYTSLGLITPQGEVLIPFENKNIKVLSGDLLLVERNTPVTENVVDALNKRNDPLSASELIETANTIKQQIKSVMGSTGTYAFDNQFSEAALYTTDGVNLANNYFSFIGVNAGAYFMSKNVVGDSIIKYDPYAYAAQQSTNDIGNQEQQQNNSSFQEEVKDNNNNTSFAAGDSFENKTEQQDVQTTSEEKNDMPMPILPNISMNKIEEENIEKDNNLNVDIPLFENKKLPEEENVSFDETFQEEKNKTDSMENQSDKLQNEEEQNMQDTNEEVNFTGNGNLEPEENSVLTSIIEKGKEDSSEDDNSNDEKDLEEEKSDDVEGGVSQEETTFSDIVNDDTNIYQEDQQDEQEIEYEESNDLENEANRDYEEQEDDFEEEINNPVIVNATNTIRKLLEENRKQRQIIDRQESEIETLVSSNEILKEENKSKTKEVISLRNSTARFRSQNNDLSRENNRLKSLNSRQEELIDNLRIQNSTLKEQVAGITALSNVVAEANTLFSPNQDENSSGYDEYGYGYLGGDDDSFQYRKKVS